MSNQPKNSAQRKWIVASDQDCFHLCDQSGNVIAFLDSSGDWFTQSQPNGFASFVKFPIPLLLFQLLQYKVADLPSGTEGEIAYATDGRKIHESASRGTGVPIYFSGGKWLTYNSDKQVAA